MTPLREAFEIAHARSLGHPVRSALLFHRNRATGRYSNRGIQKRWEAYKALYYPYTECA